MEFNIFHVPDHKNLNFSPIIFMFNNFQVHVIVGTLGVIQKIDKKLWDSRSNTE